MEKRIPQRYVCNNWWLFTIQEIYKNLTVLEILKCLRNLRWRTKSSQNPPLRWNEFDFDNGHHSRFSLLSELNQNGIVFFLWGQKIKGVQISILHSGICSNRAPFFNCLLQSTNFGQPETGPVCRFSFCFLDIRIRTIQLKREGWDAFFGLLPAGIILWASTHWPSSQARVTSVKS